MAAKYGRYVATLVEDKEPVYGLDSGNFRSDISTRSVTFAVHSIRENKIPVKMSAVSAWRVFGPGGVN